MKTEENKTVINNPSQAVHLIWNRYRILGYLYTWAIYLDRKNQVIKIRLLAFGKVGRTVITLREVVEPAIFLQASGLILLHQGVSPSPVPWEREWKSAMEMRDYLGEVQISLIDNIIVGRNRFFSMAAMRTYEYV